MAEICYYRAMLRGLANRWFQPLTHVSGGGFPRVSATLRQRGKREKRDFGRFAVSQLRAQSVHGRFA
jgi:hypothetical protein